MWARARDRQDVYTGKIHSLHIYWIAVDANDDKSTLLSRLARLDRKIPSPSPSLSRSLFFSLSRACSLALRVPKPERTWRASPAVLSVNAFCARNKSTFPMFGNSYKPPISQKSSFCPLLPPPASLAPTRKSFSARNCRSKSDYHWICHRETSFDCDCGLWDEGRRERSRIPDAAIARVTISPEPHIRGVHASSNGEGMIGR